jgi:hypothetical protein
MDYQQQLISAENLFEMGNYVEAYKLYLDSFMGITGVLSQAAGVQKVAKVGGWVAAVLTGGIGLEDVIIVPVVNKALLSILGIDLNKILELADYSLCGIVNCVPNIQADKLTDHTSILNYFLILYKMRIRKDQKTAYKDILELVNPFKQNETVVSLNTVLSRADIEAQLQQNVQSYFPNVDEINVLLLRTLYHLSETDCQLFKSLYARYGKLFAPSEEESMTVAHAKEILGIPDNVTSISKTELTRYRNEKIKEYHPDRYNNLPKDFIEFAKQKTTEINLAYEFLLSYVK